MADKKQTQPITARENPYPKINSNFERIGALLVVRDDVKPPVTRMDKLASEYLKNLKDGSR